MALGVIAALLIAFGGTALFAKIQLPRVEAFIPAAETAIFVNDFITSIMLFAHFSILRGRALFALASGYFFAAMIVIPHALTFPGLVTPTGLFGAGPQTTAWLYIIWHLGLPFAAIVYALFIDAGSSKFMSAHKPSAAIGLSVTTVIIFVWGVVWIVTTQEMHLPGILDNVGHLTLFGVFANNLLLFLGVLSLLVVWARGRSVLDMWLMVAIGAFLIEIFLSAQIAGTRFSLGYYAGRIYSLITATIVLTTLLSQTTTLYADLAQSILRRRGAREARLIAMDTMAASIAHEINQPLTAMVIKANAALRWLMHIQPNLDEARSSLERIVNDGHRASEVIVSIRSMFKKNARRRRSLDANELLREALIMVDLDLRNQQVSVTTDLRDSLPQLVADRGQMQQVIMNLIANAIEAMDSVTDRARLLRITSDISQDMSGVVVTIEDSGTGIEEKNRDFIFDPFFTTKPAGTGVGLAICQSIIESHGGSLRVSANKPHGAIFQVSLPSGDL